MTPDKAEERLNQILDDARTMAEAVYIQAVVTTLARCPSLDYLMDAMGTQFFVRKDGKIVDDEDLPQTARDLLDKVVVPYAEHFGGIGRVRRDGTVD